MQTSGIIFWGEKTSKEFSVEKKSNRMYFFPPELIGIEG